jgi:hypothetical protein
MSWKEKTYGKKRLLRQNQIEPKIRLCVMVQLPILVLLHVQTWSLFNQPMNTCRKKLALIPAVNKTNLSLSKKRF